MKETTVFSVQEAYNLGYDDGFKTASTHTTKTRYVKERTCHKELMTTEDYTGAEVEYFGCSWCGEYLSDTDCYGLSDGPNYCGNCGCKVDSSFVTDEATGEVIYRDGEKVVS